jgi:chemotaxis protein methyltransferase WspC
VSRYGEAERFLTDAIGLDPEVMGSRVIRNEVDSLMRALGTDDLTECLKELVSNEEKMGSFIEKIVVPETWFFRDRESFKFLKQYAGEILAGASGPLRVLSAPCSTGEEPFSIAMTLYEAGVTPGDFHIDAVDISKAALRIAAAAEYGRTSFRGGTKYYEEKYFIPKGERLQVIPFIAERVTFHQDNILGKTFFADEESYRIIFCKNLLIYLNPEARRRLFARLNRILMPDGVLFTGHSELASFLQNGFEAVSFSRSFACVKQGPAARTDVPGGRPTGPAKKDEERTLTRRRVKKPLAAEERKKAPEDEASVGEKKSLAPSLDGIRRLADRGSLSDARELCSRYLRDNGADKEAYCLMGLISQAEKKSDEAEAYFLKTLYLDPMFYDALLHMSLLCEQRGDPARAEIFRQRMRRIEDAEKNRRKEP